MQPQKIDKLYQLTKENDHQYKYDSLNNRIERDELPCQVSDLNLLLAQDNVDYKYDPNVNLIEKTSHNAITHFTYDAWNRLISSTTNGIPNTYTYDAFHRRLSKNNELYLYDNQNEIACINEGKITHFRLLGLSLDAEIGGAVAIEINDQTFIPLHDHNGNVASLLHPDGSLFESYKYTAFGTEPTTHYTNPWRFSSKHFDSETDLIYFGRRYYDPSTSRFTSPDPAEYEEGPNLYAYVHNNPLSHIDPYGLWELPTWEDTKNFGIGVGLGAYNAGIGMGYLAAQAGDWINADLSYEFGNDRSYFMKKSDDLHDNLCDLRSSFKNNFWQTCGNTLIPGLMEAYNLSSNAPNSDRYQAYGKAFIDVATLASVGKAGCLYAHSKLKLARSVGWVLPEKGGGALIKGRWYTEHALERMAPNTPQVMAILDARTIERTAKLGIQPQTKDFRNWLKDYKPNPRGIPPLVVEAEISHPGSTNIRVVMNKKGHVVTVIPGEK